ncbi:MAG: hypothetical protein H6Q65_2619 [Firmicutes bacterium]|nr:hypothetical protein [Bacillota bacterium]
MMKRELDVGILRDWQEKNLRRSCGILNNS